MLFLPQQSRARCAKHLAVRAVLLQNLVAFFVQHHALSWDIDMLLLWNNFWYVMLLFRQHQTRGGVPCIQTRSCSCANLEVSQIQPAEVRCIRISIPRAESSVFFTSDVMIRDTNAVDNAPCAKQLLPTRSISPVSRFGQWRSCFTSVAQCSLGKNDSWGLRLDLIFYDSYPTYSDLTWALFYSSSDRCSWFDCRHGFAQGPAASVDSSSLWSSEL